MSPDTLLEITLRRCNRCDEWGGRGFGVGGGVGWGGGWGGDRAVAMLHEKSVLI